MMHSMTLLNQEFASALAEAQPPCISLYQPTHRRHPNNLVDPITFRNLVKTLEQTLQQNQSAAEAATLLEPFLDLAGDIMFWNHTLDGLAIFAAPGLFHVVATQRPVPELVVVAQSFHTKPLRRLLQTAGGFHVLGLSRQSVRLFEGNRDAIDEIQPAPGVPRSVVEALGEELTEPHLTVASYGGTGPGTVRMTHGHGDRNAEVEIDDERFFRAVAKAVQEQHSQPAGLPLILAALPEHHALFHQVSRNPALVEDGIRCHPDALSLDDLRAKAWQILAPDYQKRLAALRETFSLSCAKGMGSGTLQQVAAAAAAGRVESLWIEAERHLPGHLDAATGEVEPAPMSDPTVDDVLDDLADLVESKGGEVLVMPAADMPTQSGVAGIFRF